MLSTFVKGVIEVADNCDCEVDDLDNPGGLQLNIGSFEPLDPNSSVKAIAENISAHFGKPVLIPVPEPRVEILEGERVSTSDYSDSMPLESRMWAFEWRPNIQVGIVKIPYERAFKHLESDAVDDSGGRVMNVLSATQGDNSSFFMNNSNKSMVLPVNADNLTILEDVSFTRRLITNTTVTQGTKYYQVFTENFPEVSITLSVVKFGGVSDRVRHFFDAVMSMSAEPRSFPGSFYMYDVFQEQMDSFSGNLFRNNYYLKYKLIPNTINKRATSSNNLMLQFTISATVVEWERR